MTILPRGAQRNGGGGPRAAWWRVWGVAALLAASPVLAEPQLVETGVGRFAVFADAASVERQGDSARMRGLQVAEQGFEVGGVAYVGGWSWWAFDCATATADRLDFAALRAAKLVPATAKRAKIVKKGDVSKKLVLKGLLATAGARAAIEAAGGKVEE